MREKEVEQCLVRSVKQVGGIALKFVSPGMAGVPDRILLFPRGRIAFAELKAPGKVMRPLQKHRKEQLERLGFTVCCVDCIEQIPEILRKIVGTEMAHKNGGDEG